MFRRNLIVCSLHVTRSNNENTVQQPYKCSRGKEYFALSMEGKRKNKEIMESHILVYVHMCSNSKLPSGFPQKFAFPA